MKRFDSGKWIKEIHENAVKHGFWDEDRPIEETFALIHSEWSEALEEYRAGRPMVWEGENGKPEGIAVELIDGVIRILDLLGKMKSNTNNYKEKMLNDYVELPIFVCELHQLTSEASDTLNFSPEIISRPRRVLFLSILIKSVFAWIKARGLDPVELMEKKHRYNKTRPYKHGKVC